MNTNENLEVKIEELSDFVKNLSDRQTLTSSDMNNLVDAFVSRVEDANEETSTRLVNDVSEALLNVLDNKYSAIKDKISTIEKFASSVLEENKNSKLSSDVERILNDIEALYSKMNIQEVQIENIIKACEGIKNNRDEAGVAALYDEVASVIKTYDDIAEVLNNNFKEFLRKIETNTSRDEFQRLRNNLENIENNQNVLVSAMNSINDKQEEVKAIVRQLTSIQGGEKFEQFQNTLNQLNRLILDTTSKADIDIIVDRIASVYDQINEFKRSFTELKENDEMRTVLNSQLNHITSQLESLKINSTSNVGEDIIRLYTSIAEFKDGVYSSINSQLKDVVASVDTQLDKITNSIVNSTLDTSETVRNLAGEVQKLHDIVAEGLNTKAYEINQSVEKQAQQTTSLLTANIKNELQELSKNIEALNCNDKLAELYNNIDSLKKGIDINSLVVQMDKIKEALDFEPIKQQIELLNKDELVGSINEKINAVLGYLKNEKTLNALEEIKNSLDFNGVFEKMDTLENKMDFTSVENGISSLKQILSNVDFGGDLASIKESLDKISVLDEKIASFKEIENAIYEIKNQIEEHINFNLQKINEDKEIFSSIQEGLKTIHDAVIEISKDNENTETINQIKDDNRVFSSKIMELISETNSNCENALNLMNGRIENLSPELEEKFEGFKQVLEASLSILSDKISRTNLENSDKKEQITDEIKSSIEGVLELIKNIHTKPLSEMFDELQNALMDKSGENTQEIKAGIENLQNLSIQNMSSVKELLSEALDKTELSAFINQHFEEVKNKFSEKIKTFEENLLNAGTSNREEILNSMKGTVSSFREFYETVAIKLVEEIISTKMNSLAEIIANKTKETQSEVSNFMQAQITSLVSLIEGNIEASGRHAVEQIAQIISDNEKAQEKINFMKQASENLSAIMENLALVKTAFETNIDFANTLVDKLDTFEENIQGSIKSSSDEINSSFREQLNNNILEVKKLTDKINENIHSTDAMAKEFFPSSAKVDNLAGELRLSLSDTKEGIEALEAQVVQNTDKIMEQLKENLEEIKSSLVSELAQNDNDENTVLAFGAEVDKKLQEKSAVIESLIDDAISKINKKSVEVAEFAHRNYKDILEKKIEGALAELKADYEAKLTDIQNIIDDKLFEVVSKNNEIIKDELKYQTDHILRDLPQTIKEKFVQNDKTEEEQPQEGEYTIKDVEADLAKIRLGIEKSNKLSNFKEFAERLVELKNVNLENAKVTRVIGADIVRFDGWLKNTTAKIELLAAKIEKSEKIKMEDLKTRLIQSEKNQAMPQKFEEALMSIYKKYRLQETKFDDVVNKLEILNQKQTETFDVKQFIDLMYDNTKKQENLVSRMNSIEDKMDLIQAKIDHIIESCIDE